MSTFAVTTATAVLGGIAPAQDEPSEQPPAQPTITQRAAVDTGHGVATCVRIHPKGQLTATTGHDGAVRIWNVADLAKVQELEKPPGQHWALAFSPDGKHLAAGSDNELFVYKVGKPGKQWKHTTISLRGGKYPQSIYAIEFTPNGKYLAVGSQFAMDEKATSVFFFDAKKWRPVDTGVTGHSAIGQPAIIEFLAFADHGKALATGGFTRALRIWQPGRGKKQAAWREAAMHLDPTKNGQPLAHTMCAAFSPDGKRLIVGSTSGDACVYEGKSWSETKRFRAQPGAHVTALWWSGDGRHVLTGGRDLRVFDTADWSTVSETPIEWGPADSKVMTLDMAPGAERLLAVGADGRLLAFDVNGLADRKAR